MQFNFLFQNPMKAKIPLPYKCQKVLEKDITVSGFFKIKPRMLPIGYMDPLKKNQISNV